MNRKILVIDDDDAVREIVSYMLELKYTGKVMVAAEGQQALDLIYKTDNVFDVIITDINMPNGMGGIELLSNLKEKDNKSIKIVMSGYIKNQENDQIHQLSNHFFEKPLDFKELINVINNAITTETK